MYSADVVEPTAGEPRSPLNLVVLALLHEESMHPYRMQKLISERGKDEVVNIRSRNSVQQAVGRLERDGLITAESTEREGNYPPRTVYAITEAGREQLRGTLRRMLATPAREYPAFPAALSLMAVLPPRTAAKLLRQRRAELSEQLEHLVASTEQDPSLPRILLIEDDYRIAVHRAEIEWLDRTLETLDSGELTWSPRRLIAQSYKHER